VALDFKYDGQRAQIHAQREEGTGRWRVDLFSRHLETMTDKYPDVVALLPEVLAPDVHSVVLDAEIVAVANGAEAAAAAGPPRFLPFQTLSTRGRKGVAAEDVTVAVCVCAFDLMLLNGQPLLRRPYLDRRALLAVATQPQRARFVLTELRAFPADEAALDGMRALLHRALASPCCEGIMAKPVGYRPGTHPLLDALLRHDEGAAPPSSDTDAAERGLAAWAAAMAGGPVPPATPTASTVPVAERLATLDRWAVAAVTVPTPAAPASMPRATYEPARRTSSWLKVKKDYLDGLVDSLDLVPIGAWWGNGRKAGWLSPFLMACYNPATEEWEAVCKCMSVGGAAAAIVPAHPTPARATLTTTLYQPVRPLVHQGFSDAFYREQTAFYLDADAGRASTERMAHVVDDPGGLQPDFWLLPCQVWEIRGADLTLSPTHPAARSLLGSGRGISLRFPRFVRLRPDKKPEEATTPTQLVAMYRQQTTIAGAAAAAALNEADEDAWV